MLKTWYIANTTVRNPYRLKDGLTAIANSPLQGNMRKREGDKALSELLGNAGLVTYREDMPDKSFSAGRKWRSALGSMGFLYPEAKKGLSQESIGPLDCLTPNGRRLIESTTVAGEQECFLRALAGQVKTIPLLEGGTCTFNPLLHVLTVMKLVEERTGDPSLSGIELAVWVFSTAPCESYDEIVDNLLELRERRSKAVAKRRFDDEEYVRCAKIIGSSKPHTFKDYLDVNSRYLKSTGLLQSKGRGLTIVPEKKTFAYEWIELPKGDLQTEEALASQCNGAPLPTDDAATAVRLLRQQAKTLTEYYAIPFDLPEFDEEDARDVEQVRFSVEDALSKAKEERYALAQREEHVEISTYLNMLATRKYEKTLDAEDEEITLKIPRSEAAAYMEWVVWRAFLAMDSMACKPYEARRFNVDQDFLPLSTAPGRGSDLVIEYEDCLVAVEVTLTESSRQEAAEGEPVRRHVADLAAANPDKDVYGLFIANKIDSNTAETFRHGTWYYADDTKSQLAIVPLTTNNFGKLFSASFRASESGPALLKEAISRCDLAKEGLEAPEWKRGIDQVVESLVSF